MNSQYAIAYISFIMVGSLILLGLLSMLQLYHQLQLSQNVL